MLATFFLFSCARGGARPASSTATASARGSHADSARPVIPAADAALPASQTGGFDGAKAYDYVAKLVSFGPHPPDTPAMRRVQSYIQSQLHSFGCPVDVDAFHAQTPVGTLAMENIIAKIPGTGHGIILLLTHYDTLRLANFVGADDSGSSSGLMLEMARLLCRGKEGPNAVWIAFLDGEEAQLVVNGQAQWTKTDSVFGSRELAARLDLSGNLKRVRAVVLADMIGQKGLHILRETNSTTWLTNLVWNTAGRLGYQKIFLNGQIDIADDHIPFIERGVPAVDIIDFKDYAEEGYWHTTQDTLDKISPRSLSIVGYVILDSVRALQQKFH